LRQQQSRRLSGYQTQAPAKEPVPSVRSGVKEFELLGTAQIA